MYAEKRRVTNDKFIHMMDIKYPELFWCFYRFILKEYFTHTHIGTLFWELACFEC